MKLTQERQTKVIEKLRKLWVNHACNACGSTNWTVMDRLLEMRELTKGGELVVGGHLLPVIAIACDNCGNLRFVNPITLGLIDPNTGDFIDG